MDLGSTLLLVFFFTLLEAFFSGMEIALISANRFKIQSQADEDLPSAKILSNLLKTPEKLFAITSFGTNLAVVSSTSIFAAYMVARFADKGDLYATLLLGPFILFGGEIVPKLIFQSRADQLVLILIQPLMVFGRLFSPFIKIFTWISNLLLKMTASSEESGSQTYSREMIQKILTLDSRTSDLGATEREMIHNIFNFGEQTVEQCMTPLVQIYCLADTATLEDAHQSSIASGFSRLPIFHERMSNLIGVLNTFDLLNLPSDKSSISGLIRPIYYVPPNKKTDDLLRDLQQRGLHMAIVVDEYGGCIGVVTVEDLLEEIVGEIEDEYDKPEKQAESYAEGGFLVEGNMEIDAVNETLGLELPKGDYETIAGLIIDQLENIPARGEQVVANGFRLTVKETGKRKIHSVIVRKIEPSTDDKSAKDQASAEENPKSPASTPTPDKLFESPKT